jgi:hypothetical protein
MGATHREASVAAWDIPAAVAAGEHFAVKVGAKSSTGCALAGCRIEVLDDVGAVVARGRLGATPWPGTEALFWSEVELCAPSVPGIANLAVRFDGAVSGESGSQAVSPFTVAVVAAPEHVVTVTVTADGRPVPDAIVRAGAVRTATDGKGRARLHLAKGAHEIVVWKAGFEAAPLPLSVDADATVTIEARAEAEDDPDAVWTA